MTQTLRHNKKRNVGLLNEFFAKYIAKAIIEKNDSNINKAKLILKKHFNKETELYKELKLFNSLYKTKVSNKESALSLINQVKESCKWLNRQKADLEKTALLHEINMNLSDNEFFDRQVNDYKIHATIHVLLNSWKSDFLQENLSDLIQLEDKLLEFLTEQKEQIIDHGILQKTQSDIDQLVVNIMFEKLNSKFGTTLNDEQKNLINLYVFSQQNENTQRQLFNLLESVNQRVDNLISIELNKELDDSTKLKLKDVKFLLQENKNDPELNDNKISFYLAVLKLEKELKNVE